jgi:hypothetical protein
LRLKRCFFDLQEMEYLGYTMSHVRISVSTEEVMDVANAYDGEGGWQFREIMQLLRQVCPSLHRPYGYIDELNADIPVS